MQILPVQVQGPITPMEPRASGELRIGQFNAHNLFDTKNDSSTQDPVPTRDAYREHLGKLAVAIRDAMGAPDIITMQEVENGKVLKDLVARPELQGLGYKALLREGTDPRGIDNAILYRDTVSLTAVEQIDPAKVNAKGRESHLFTRPPLVATFAVKGAAQAKEGVKELTVIASHFTSKLGGEEAAAKRQAQAEVVANYVTGMVALNKRAPVLVAGDLNMESSEKEFAPLRETRRAASLVSLVNDVAVKNRFSWRDGKQHLMLDHFLATKSFAAKLSSIAIPHIDTASSKEAAADPASAAGASDHDPLVATFTL